ncbi:unnamed protein product [Cladocopium goreaui]|uniref:Peptidase C1A papain C-terminal domain-containing protein n=1 Tax=Cladocopium goreaui TaxID=2562237 RepID=A0A9P1FF75_9DINO|nr:unnamed protein product [Cladocopium goreaui]
MSNFHVAKGVDVSFSKSPSPNFARYLLRKSIFEQRAAEIAAQNAKGTTWKAGFNDLTDLTNEELKQRLGYRKELQGAVSAEAVPLPQLRGGRSQPNLPESLDWRKHTPSVVSPVKSWGPKEESRVALQTGVLLSLSPQELTSCTPNVRRCGGSGGCTGATSQLAFKYIENQGGISDIWNYPYLSGTKYETLDCEAYNGTVYWPPKASITGHVNVIKNDAAALMEAVMEGPVAVSVDASNWWLYHGGIFDSCNKTAPNINHAVVLDGFGSEKGINYWLIRNSWGTIFGEAGYIRLRRYDEEPCGYDPYPLHGTACEAGGQVTVRTGHG